MDPARAGRSVRRKREGVLARGLCRPGPRDGTPLTPAAQEVAAAAAPAGSEAPSPEDPSRAGLRHAAVGAGQAHADGRLREVKSIIIVNSKRNQFRFRQATVSSPPRTDAEVAAAASLANPRQCRCRQCAQCRARAQRERGQQYFIFPTSTVTFMQVIWLLLARQKFLRSIQPGSPFWLRREARERKRKIRQAKRNYLLGRIEQKITNPSAYAFNTREERYAKRRRKGRAYQQGVASSEALRVKVLSDGCRADRHGAAALRAEIMTPPKGDPSAAASPFARPPSGKTLGERKRELQAAREPPTSEESDASSVPWSIGNGDLYVIEEPEGGTWEGGGVFPGASFRSFRSARGRSARSLRSVSPPPDEAPLPPPSPAASMRSVSGFLSYSLAAAHAGGMAMTPPDPPPFPSPPTAPSCARLKAARPPPAPAKSVSSSSSSSSVAASVTAYEEDQGVQLLGPVGLTAALLEANEAAEAGRGAVAVRPKAEVKHDTPGTRPLASPSSGFLEVPKVTSMHALQSHPARDPSMGLMPRHASPTPRVAPALPPPPDPVLDPARYVQQELRKMRGTCAGRRFDLDAYLANIGPQLDGAAAARAAPPVLQIEAAGEDVAGAVVPAGPPLVGTAASRSARALTAAARNDAARPHGQSVRVRTQETRRRGFRGGRAAAGVKLPRRSLRTSGSMSMSMSGLSSGSSLPPEALGEWRSVVGSSLTLAANLAVRLGRFMDAKYATDVFAEHGTACRAVRQGIALDSTTEGASPDVGAPGTSVDTQDVPMLPSVAIEGAEGDEEGGTQRLDLPATEPAPCPPVRTINLTQPLRADRAQRLNASVAALFADAQRAEEDCHRGGAGDGFAGLGAILSSAAADEAGGFGAPPAPPPPPHIERIDDVTPAAAFPPVPPPRRPRTPPEIDTVTDDEAGAAARDGDLPAPSLAAGFEWGRSPPVAAFKPPPEFFPEAADDDVAPYSPPASPAKRRLAPSVKASAFPRAYAAARDGGQKAKSPSRGPAAPAPAPQAPPTVARLQPKQTYETKPQADVQRHLAQALEVEQKGLSHRGMPGERAAPPARPRPAAPPRRPKAIPPADNVELAFQNAQRAEQGKGVLQVREGAPAAHSPRRVVDQFTPRPPSVLAHSPTGAARLRCGDAPYDAFLPDIADIGGVAGGQVGQHLSRRATVRRVPVDRLVDTRHEPEQLLRAPLLW
eukprot:TRINITY_DN3531_c0_g1_i1.p1 TRINITY_DN3531_c0_g1~~TRINITY_DN3531_c0_g1_i1.p1  ORF type:complete len:1220 (+),score=365.84 TRINITY_DN3531_c0_g1_i1:67-3660(+)